MRGHRMSIENNSEKVQVNPEEMELVARLRNSLQDTSLLLKQQKEENENMKEEMKEFCSLLYGIGEELDGIIVDESIYTKVSNPNLEKTIFFGDDDYNNFFLEMAKSSEKLEINLLMGHYFFLGNEKIFANHFSNVIDEEEYVQTIQNSKYLLTASLQTALESLSCGNKPVLFKRDEIGRAHV